MRQPPLDSGYDEDQERVPAIKMAAGILWPAFLTSGFATILVFTVFDPVEIFQCIGGPDVSRLGAYTVGFFMLWGLTAVSSALTWYFEKPDPRARRSSAH